MEKIPAYGSSNGPRRLRDSPPGYQTSLFNILPSLFLRRARYQCLYARLSQRLSKVCLPDAWRKSEEEDHSDKGESQARIDQRAFGARFRD
jgi:hypothetical protein